MNELNLDGMALAPGVVETIVSIAANEVEGVASVDEDDKLVISVRVDVYYGYVLPDLAANLRQAVADAVASQVGAQVSSVDVYIDGIQFAG